jgi:hypothetical protein
MIDKVKGNHKGRLQILKWKLERGEECYGRIDTGKDIRERKLIWYPVEGFC